MRKRIPFLVNAALAVAAFSVTTAVTLHARPATTEDSMSLPALSRGQQRNILSILHSDPYLRALLLHRHYSVGGPSVWSTRKGTVLGGVVNISFNPAIRVFSGRWLGLDYDCSETHAVPYGRRPYTAAYENVRGLTVWVDELRQRVAGIAPTVKVNRNSESTVTHSSLTPIRRRQYYSETCHD